MPDSDEPGANINNTSYLTNNSPWKWASKFFIGSFPGWFQLKEMPMKNTFVNYHISKQQFFSLTVINHFNKTTVLYKNNSQKQ